MENYRFVIAEKPPAGLSIAKAIGATTHDEGFIYGNGCIDSWRVGQHYDRQFRCENNFGDMICGAFDKNYFM